MVLGLHEQGQAFRQGSNPRPPWQILPCPKLGAYFWISEVKWYFSRVMVYFELTQCWTREHRIQCITFAAETNAADTHTAWRRASQYLLRFQSEQGCRLAKAGPAFARFAAETNAADTHSVYLLCWLTGGEGNSNTIKILCFIWALHGHGPTEFYWWSTVRGNVNRFLPVQLPAKIIVVCRPDGSDCIHSGTAALFTSAPC